MPNKLVTNLSGGINVKTSPLIIKDTEAELILNYNLDTLGALTKRAGYTTYASQPASGKTINGLFQYTNTTTTAETTQVMVANNAGDTQGVIYYNSSGTWTASKSTDTASKRTYFTTFLDYIFRVNGADVVATSNNINGSSWGTTNAPSTITPKFVNVFQDRVYVANGATTNGSRLWFSSLPSSGSITWTTATDFVDINPDDGDQITALENNGNRLLVFKNRALYRWVYGQTEPDRLIGVGTSSQDCVKTNLDAGITFFANPQGVYAYTGNRPKLISRKIQKYIDAVSDWTAVYAEIDRDHYYLSVGSVTVDSRTFSNCMLVYTISLDAWVIYNFTDAVKVMARLIPSGVVEGIYFGSNNGRTYQFLTGTSDTTVSGTVNAINAELLTKEHLINFPGKAKVNFIDVIAQQHIGCNNYIRFDREKDPIPLKNLSGRITNLIVPNNKCRTIQLRITDNSKSQSIIEGYNIDYDPLPERQV